MGVRAVVSATVRNRDSEGNDQFKKDREASSNQRLAKHLELNRPAGVGATSGMAPPLATNQPAATVNLSLRQTVLPRGACRPNRVSSHLHQAPTPKNGQ